VDPVAELGQPVAQHAMQVPGLAPSSCSTVHVETQQQRAEQEQGAPVQEQDRQAADGEAPEPRHRPSLARVRVTEPHPMRVTTSHPIAA
jgi:hypothetical protein